jgi:uncharacterized protein DUF3619
MIIGIKTMSKHDEDELATKIKQDLDESIEALDANTLSRLRQLRAKAIERSEPRKYPTQGLLIGGLATACVMVLAVILLLNPETSVQTVPVEELELISSMEHLDLLEDLEFYEWLEEDGLQS